MSDAWLDSLDAWKAASPPCDGHARQGRRDAGLVPVRKLADLELMRQAVASDQPGSCSYRRGVELVREVERRESASQAFADAWYSYQRATAAGVVDEDVLDRLRGVRG